MIGTLASGFILGFLVGGGIMAGLLEHLSRDWAVERSLMEAGMVRIFEKRLGIAKGSGRDALDAWKANRYGLSKVWGAEPVAMASNGDEIDPDLS